MGIAGSILNADFMQKFLGLRAESVDMVEVLRRIKLEIYDKSEYNTALAWVKENCPEGMDVNTGINPGNTFVMSKDEQWEFCVKMTLILRDIMLGNEELKKLGRFEESNGRNAIMGGFQGQRQWTDWLPNADFSESILNSTFNWNGKKQPTIFATENDTLHGTAMLFGHLLTGRASIFADVRTYWSADAVKRVTGKEPTGIAAGGFIHLINSGAAAVDATGMAKDENGVNLMKRWWDVTDDDIKNMLSVTDWCQGNLGYFRGGGYSSHFKTQAEMPVTMMRVNLVEGVGPTLQIAEGFTATLPDDIHNVLDLRTDKTWPTTWFVPRTDPEKPAFTDVYSVMANWGANHGSLTYGHIGADLITLASMLRIPVSMHNVPTEKIYRPAAWNGFGTESPESADYRACAYYGALYR
jgi:L-fucose isomerase